jgi:hypothetical protein
MVVTPFAASGWELVSQPHFYSKISLRHSKKTVIPGVAACDKI